MHRAFDARHQMLLGPTKGILSDIGSFLRRGTLRVGAIIRRIDDSARFAAEADAPTVREASNVLAQDQVLPAVTTGEHLAAQVVDRQIGGKVIKTWRTKRDDKVRKWHVEADGQIRDIDDPFSVGPDFLDKPRDPAGTAANVIRCRCTADHNIVPLL